MKKDRGAVLLITVLIVSAISASIASSLILIGTDNLQISNNFSDSAKAKALVDSCAETALARIKTDNAITGNYNTNINGQTCSYNIINTSGQNRTIQVLATVNSSTKRLQININQITPQIIVNNWQQINNF